MSRGVVESNVRTNIYSEQVVVIAQLFVDPIGPAVVTWTNDAKNALALGAMIPVQS